MTGLRRITLLAMSVLPVVPDALRGQDLNIVLPVDSIEYLLSEAPFELPDALVGTRFEGDRTQQVSLSFDDETLVLTKWAPAPRGGEEFNNNPRYEIAAYELQKLFLEESEYVVPPTVPRAVSLSWYQTLDDRVDPTFRDTNSVLVVLQSFIYGVTGEGVFDLERFASDPAYARNWANANLLTHFIFHSDSNEGNLLISTFPFNRRIFSVDNGVAFGSEESNRGTRWRNLQVDRFPAATVERLRNITEEQLNDALGVVAQWEIVNSELVRVDPTENLRPRRGVREEDGVIQIGLTEEEIDDVWNRIEDFVNDADRGRFSTF